MPESMIWWLVGAGVVGVAAWYLLGRWLLKREGQEWLGVPMEYDGKGSYEAWAAQMSAAREAQRREEDGD